MTCTKHTWTPLNKTKVICSECKKEQYISKLTLKQREKLKPKYQPEPQDYLMFVGESFYTKEKFIDEARRMGVCKRIPMLPRGIVKGKSRVFLASKQHLSVSSEIEENSSELSVSIMEIFAYFVVRGISYVVAPNVNLPKALEERGVTAYTYVEGGFGGLGERGCGSLAVEAMYLLSEEDMEKCRDLAQRGTLEGNIVVLDEPIQTSLRRFRGYRCIDGDMLLGGKHEVEWLLSGYGRYKRNKKAIRHWKAEKKRIKRESEKNG